MKASLEKDRKYLIWNNQRGIAHVISRDYRWFQDEYLPAVKQLEKAGLKKDRFLLSDCYYMISDIHDFNACPKTAIQAYRKSFELDPENAPALREIGSMYERMGYYKKAASALKKSLQIDPNDDFALSDYEVLDTSGTPLYQKNDICWQAREYLAQNEPKSALKLLSKKRSIPARQITACAYGVLDDTDAALEQWSRIASAKGIIEMGFADWFYMTDPVWNHAAFWESIAQCAKQDRFTYGIWPIFDNLYDKVIPFPKHRKRNSKADLKRCNKCNYLLAQYHIARINRNLKLAQKLLRQYPNWKEIEKLCKKLSR